MDKATHGITETLLERLYRVLFLLPVLLTPLLVFCQTGKNFVRTWVATAPEADGNSLIFKGRRQVKESTLYLDGLGRPEQTVIKGGSLINASNLGGDLVSPVVYDQFGREAKTYLPYVTSAIDGAFKVEALIAQQAFYTGSASPVANQNESFFYIKTDFESSPLNRVIKQTAPGINWAGASNGGRGATTEFQVNTEADDVKIWSVVDVEDNFGTYTVASSSYPAGRLYKTVSIDEMGKRAIEFKDKGGRVILKKLQLGSLPGDGYTGWLCTYYIYDDLNQLRAVIQPKAVEELARPGVNWQLSPGLLAELSFRYEYDHLGRMIMKKIPGAGAVFMVYDARDRMVFMQDANMRNTGQWLATLYDALNRPVLTGLINYSGTLFSLQATVLSTLR